jgi:6-phosphofructokinase 1
MSKKIAILTGGGDCPGLNPVIRAVVRASSRRGWQVLGVEDAFNGLVDLEYRYPHGNRWLTEGEVGNILTRGGTILGTSNRADPFHFVPRDNPGADPLDVSDLVIENFRKLGLQAVISVGGDGSMRIAQKFHDKGLPIVGVPKTIDNDLLATDQTFGFDTAVHVATDAIDRIRDTAESHDRVMLVEVMGRDAGWIALHSGLAGGAHVIVIPEIPYDCNAIAETIRRRSQRSRPYSVVVVAEGARPIGGRESTIDGVAGSMPRHAGAAARLADALCGQIPHDMRVTVLGHTQRGGTPSSFDRVLGTRFGYHAVELVAAGKFGSMVALRVPEIVAVPLQEATRGQKLIEPSGAMIDMARGLGICMGDEVARAPTVETPS